MPTGKKLLLEAFVKSEAVSPDMLRILHGENGWSVCSDDVMLMRPNGSTHFDTPLQAFRVLAGVGIRCAVVEWDGLDAFREPQGTKPMSTLYSLRAECMADAVQLRRLVSREDPGSELSMTPDGNGLPDQDIEIRTTLTQDELLNLIRTIPDGHVMKQSLEPVPLTQNSLLKQRTK